ALAAGDDGLDPYRAILAGLPPLLAPDATLLFEVDPRRADQLAALCAALWPAAAVGRHPDLTGRERVLEVRLPGPGVSQ
ncbi:MAG TPA: peptide chain release factor N(5)-glutamine methyltransferase, partial [Candidatus Dormibacteraeota bacterium]|nr:peptide chain release factor N(5)-glutamine methyltransferase [Candidatus Dormibacteraeota bacterium]